jgi:DNA-binding NtrC family response regulator
MQEVAEKNFRLDLYHRLGVMLIHVPSLNNRREDIPLLVTHFLSYIAKEYNQPVKDIDANAMELLSSHNWTGNIRELKNAVERLVILSERKITKKDIETYILMR